jgi:hypothetical protein
MKPHRPTQNVANTNTIHPSFSPWFPASATNSKRYQISEWGGEKGHRCAAYIFSEKGDVVAEWEVFGKASREVVALVSMDFFFLFDYVSFEDCERIGGSPRS